MALPDDITVITVTDTYVDLEGCALSGTVEFTPSAQLTDAADGLVLGQRPVVACLDDTGTFTVVLPCTDNTGLTAAPAATDGPAWTYVVVIDVDGSGYTTTPFTALFPSSLGATVTLRTVAAAALTAPPSGSVVTEN